MFPMFLNELKEVIRVNVKEKLPHQTVVYSSVAIALLLKGTLPHQFLPVHHNSSVPVAVVEDLLCFYLYPKRHIPLFRES